MATAALVPVEEYFRSSWDPDREYVDGVIVERNWGALPHSFLQTAFWSRFTARGLTAFVELRTRVKPRRFRVPDVLAMHERPKGGILRMPPYIVVEILSPEDRHSLLRERVNDYLDFSVPNIWVVDPALRTVSAWTRKGSVDFVGTAVTSDGLISIPFDDIFDELSKYDAD